MDASRGEMKIHEILEKSGLPYIMEYSIEGLNSSNGKPLRFDFAVFDDDGFQIFYFYIKENSIMNQVQNLVGKKVFINNNLMIIKRDGFVLCMILN